MKDFLIGKFFAELLSIRNNAELDEQDMLRELEECIDANFEKYKALISFEVKR